jgi:hypothetical protein
VDVLLFPRRVSAPGRTALDRNHADHTTVVTLDRTCAGHAPIAENSNVGHEWSGGLKDVVPKERAIRTGVPTASRRNDDDGAAGGRGWEHNAMRSTCVLDRGGLDGSGRVMTWN